MRHLLDWLYLAIGVLATPWLLVRAVRRGKKTGGLVDRFLGRTQIDRPASSPVWFHGVSVGEVHLLRGVIAAFRLRFPEVPVVVSATTDTGLDEARRCFPDLSVIRFPLDFSWAVDRAIEEVRPRLLVLAESELWPNLLLAAKRRRIPACVINLRFSPTSARRWLRFNAVTRRVLALVDRFGVQTQEFAQVLHRLGVHRRSITVTGSVKYDGVETNRANPRTTALRRLFGLDSHDFVWVAGSTQPMEESLALTVYRRLRPEFPHLKLILVPRQKDRFEPLGVELADGGFDFVRRSRLERPVERAPDVVLVDTIGELSAVWGLADVAMVGGSFDGRRGGQNMIEPAAFGAATVFGPHVWNFRDTAARLTADDAAIQLESAEQLEEVMRSLITDAARRIELSVRSRRLMLSQQGATNRTLDLITELLDRVGGDRSIEPVSSAA